MGLPAFSSENLTRKLSKLGRLHQLAFGASCCERLLPNYVAFREDTGWGDLGPIRTALDKTWKHLFGGSLTSERTRDLIESCEQVTPASDDFESLYVTAAQDACFAVCSLLDYVLDVGTDKIVRAATYATDSVDLYVQESEGLLSSDPSLEQKILNHPLMQRELEKQDQDISTLSKRPFLDIEFLEEFRASWDNRGKSNLNLS